MTSAHLPRRKLRGAPTLLLCLASLFLLTTLALADGATLATDKPDYTPGEEAILTGAGFAPLEAIDLSIALEDPITGVVVRDWEWAQGGADDQGGFTAYYLVPEIAAGMNLIATATGLTSGLEASVRFTDAPPVRKYSAAISGVTPSPVVAGSAATFTLTITNSTDSNMNLGSANITVPSWTDVSLGTVTGPAGKDWSATLVTGVIELRPQAPQGQNTLAPGEAVSVVITATPPDADTYVWTTAARQSTDFSGTASFDLVGSQPSIVVEAASVDTTLELNSVAPGSVTFGSAGPVAFTATLTRDDTDAGVDGATVDFSVDGDAVGSETTAGGGIAVFDYDPSTLAPGSHTVQASFAGQVIGGTTFVASTSGTKTFDVTMPTTLVLNSIVPGSVTVGSSGPVTLTATLTRNDSDAGIEGATIEFTLDGESVGTALTETGGVAMLDYDPSALAPGSHTVQASFAGEVIDGITFEASTSDTGTLDVTVPTTLVLNSVSPDSVSVGSTGPVALTATLTRNDTDAGVVGASVDFTVDGNAAGSTTTAAGGIATLNYDPSTLAPGSHTVQASFAGEKVGGITFEASTSGTKTLNVTVPTTLGLSVSPDQVILHAAGPVTFTATLTRNDTNAGVVGATVGFTVDGNAVGSEVTGAGGIATLSYDPSALAPGSHSVQASFAGQVIGGITFEASTSSAQTLCIVYNFIGFLPPIDNLPLWNVAKAGRTIPVKWRLTDANGAFITSLAVVLHNPLRYRQTGYDTAPGDLVETTTTGATVLRYDSTANQFVYNWQTLSSFANQCYELLLELNDGTVYIAKFKFTR